MGRSAKATLVVAAFLVLSGIASAARPHIRATTAQDGTVRIGGVPTFPIGVGWPTPAIIPRALTLGIGILQGNGPGATQLAISQAVGTKGWIVPQYAPKQLHMHYRNAIGYTLPDEPDGNGLLPATAGTDAGPRVPYTERAAEDGRADPPDADLPLHERAAEVRRDRRRGVPGLHGERRRRPHRHLPVRARLRRADPGLSLSMVYDAMVELKRLEPGKAAGEWIETGPIEGYCGLDPVTPEAARAEAWAAVAGGAQALFWFTHTFTKGYWDDFDVSPEMGASDGVDRTRSSRFSQIVLRHRNRRRVLARTTRSRSACRLSAAATT